MMKCFSWISSVVSFILIFTACASVERMNREHEKKVSAEFLRSKCNAEYFYQDGMNDAMGERYMSTDDITRYCKKKDFARFRNSYTKGYKAGLKSLKTQDTGSGITGSSFARELPSCSLGARRHVQCTDTGGEAFQFNDSGCSIKCNSGRPVCKPAGCEVDGYGKTTGYGLPSSCSCE